MSYELSCGVEGMIFQKAGLILALSCWPSRRAQAPVGRETPEIAHLSSTITSLSVSWTNQALQAPLFTLFHPPENHSPSFLPSTAASEDAFPPTPQVSQAGSFQPAPSRLGSSPCLLPQDGRAVPGRCPRPWPRGGQTAPAPSPVK